MKNLFTLAILLGFTQLSAQPDTEVYLVDLKTTDGKMELANPRNISNNEGYDNQPSFYDDRTLLFSSTRKGQTDLAIYKITNGATSWITDTPYGSEYSPLKIPNTEEVSSIRLDGDGKQFLYRYDLASGESKTLLKDLKVGYHVWYKPHIVVSSVLVEDRMDLVVSDLKNNTHDTLQKNVGRSLHKIPNSDLISFIGKENETWEIRSLHPISGATEKIVDMIPTVEDMCWLLDGTIVIGKDNRLLKFDPKTDTEWGLLKTFRDKNINRITRLATNDSNTLLALVAEVSPEIIVQKQLDAYNARDIEAFLATYSDDVKVYNFPNTPRYEGKDKMRESYGDFFKTTPDLHCEIKNRIVIGNKVVDEEYLTMNGRNFSAVAIYEVENGKIAKVTFVR